MTARAQTPVSKTLITLAVVVLYIVARKIPLPSITASAEAPYLPHSVESIMALGYQPLLTGYVLVECAALLVPKWRPLRAGSQAGRAQLHRASLIIGMIVALVQALFLALAFQKRGAGLSPAATAGTVITLLGATAALIVLTWFADRDGLGSGFSALILAAAILGISSPIGNALTAVQFGAIPFSALFTEVLGLAALVIMTLFLFSPYCLPNTSPDALMISRPACGVTPLTAIPQILALGALVSKQIQPGWATAHKVFTSSSGSFFACVISAFVFAFLFNRPERIAAAWNAFSPNPPEGVPRLKAVMLESFLFIALAIGVQAGLVSQLGARRAPNAANVIFATAIICDFIREWRARQANAHLTFIWEIHQTYAVVPAMRLLESQGLHPFARGLHLRSLLQFFGPYVPIQILVPGDEAQACHALLQDRCPSPDTSHPDLDCGD